jgi:hypothetical protein
LRLNLLKVAVAIPQKDCAAKAFPEQDKIQVSVPVKVTGDDSGGG